MDLEFSKRKDARSLKQLPPLSQVGEGPVYPLHKLQRDEERMMRRKQSRTVEQFDFLD